VVGEYKTIKLTRSEGVVRLTLDLPPLNIMTIAMMEEINDALETLKGVETLKALVIGAEGKAFSAGVDIADHTVDKVERMIGVFHDIFRNMRTIRAPIVAAVQGAALGGGCELALSCDIVLASDRAKLGQPEIAVGVFPPVAAVILTNLVGRQKALELVLTGAIVKADEAHAMGLVNQVFPADEFQRRVDEYVAGLACLSAPVLQLTKRAVYEGMGLPFDEALKRVERIYLGELMATDDAREGLAAFLEKRKPVWRNQ
jgi:cyclohexa-1,5-dienecarbonyl-CoA hydratase